MLESQRAIKVLMLGWEYPPHIAGGLGTACQGLTSALAARGVFIHFVVPQLFGDEAAVHMVLSNVGERAQTAGVAGSEKWSGAVYGMPTASPHGEKNPEYFSSSSVCQVHRIPAFIAPYWSAAQFEQAVTQLQHEPSEIFRGPADEFQLPPQDLKATTITAASPEPPQAGRVASELAAAAAVLYPTGSGIFAEVERFTEQVVRRLARTDFDIIHAHDWMTFPAGVALARITGAPLVVHVHSLEQDRSGIFLDRTIEQVERFGVQAADRVITVSHFTRRAVERHHAIAPAKLRVVHNGVYPRESVQAYRLRDTWPKQVVLFLGRITYQKGPEYFVEVAARVAAQLPDVLFVVAGAGDLESEIQARVRRLGLEKRFRFPGFLSGDELEQAFSTADLYVMPSVSEPFGLTALEAINFDTPVLVSNQSGVAEVLSSALKVDFWDIDGMTSLIVAALQNEELRRDLVRRAKAELRQLHWGSAAEKTEAVYREVLQAAGVATA
jgi:glycosyltransferase involved in cell wall biosynthesis